LSYLLDASILISWFKGRRPAVELMNDLTDGADDLAVNTIAVTEVYSGIADKDQEATNLIFAAFDYWAIDEVTARLAGQYRYRYAREGRPLSVTDVLMAASAVRHGATLVTSNVKDFPMPELKLLPVSGA